MTHGIHMVAKPAGPACNLGCEYCFYLEKQALFLAGQECRMRDEVLASFIGKYIAAQPAPVVEFVWQGGEPTLAGVDFFRHIRKYLRVMTQLLEHGLSASLVMEAVKGPLAILQGEQGSRNEGGIR